MRVLFDFFINIARWACSGGLRSSTKGIKFHPGEVLS
nr:MAG TPA: hypothetical protein [Bacteriophage sp.]